MEMKNNAIKECQKAMLKTKKTYREYRRKIRLHLKKGEKEIANNNKTATGNKITTMVIKINKKN